MGSVTERGQVGGARARQVGARVGGGTGYRRALGPLGGARPTQRGPAERQDRDHDRGAFHGGRHRPDPLSVPIHGPGGLWFSPPAVVNERTASNRALTTEGRDARLRSAPGEG